VRTASHLRCQPVKAIVRCRQRPRRAASQSPAIALPAGSTITLRFPFFFAPLNPGSLIEAGVDRVTIVRQ
jgi:hypothetical protein